MWFGDRDEAGGSVEVANADAPNGFIAAFVAACPWPPKPGG